MPTTEKKLESTEAVKPATLTIEEQLNKALERIKELEERPIVKGIDQYFSLEHQGMIAAKYSAKYSEADQAEHKTAWPEFQGNHFVMYVLAETQSEARKAVFSANRTILLAKLSAAMVSYTPTVPGAVLTELQTILNKSTELQLQELYTIVAEEAQRIDLLKAFGKTLKQAAKTGKDMDTAKLKFFHASAVLGIVPNTIW